MKHVSTLVAMFVMSTAPSLVIAQTTAHALHDGHAMQTLEEVAWATPAQHKLDLPQQLRVAVLHGDPNVAGKPFTMLISHPDGWRVPPHRHPVDENLTVLRGTWMMGTGETYNEHQARLLDSGAYAFMPAGVPHFAFCKGETIVQIHGIGPFKVILVNPGDPMRGATLRPEDARSDSSR